MIKNDITMVFWASTEGLLYRKPMPCRYAMRVPCSENEMTEEGEERPRGDPEERETRALAVVGGPQHAKP